MKLPSLWLSACATLFALRVHGQCAAPVITSQPQSATIAWGDSVTLNVGATSTPGNPTAFAWYYVGANGTSVKTSASGPSATFTPQQTTDYFVWAVNTCGQTITNLVRVTVTGVLTADLTDGVLCNDVRSSRLDLTIKGPGPYAINWYEYVPGQPSIKLPNTGTDAFFNRPGQFFAWVYNNTDSAITRLATIGSYNDSLLKIAPIVASPRLSTRLGDGVTLYAAIDRAADSIQWYQGVGLAAHPLASDISWVTVTPPSKSDTTYWVEATNRCGHSRAYIDLRACEGPPAVGWFLPQTLTVSSGTSVPLAIAAGINGADRYDWYEMRAGETSSRLIATYSYPAWTYVQPTTKTYYFVWMYNGCGSAVSAVTTVLMVGGIDVASQPQDVTISAGQPATLSITASGSGPLVYDWYRWDYVTGSHLAGHTSSITVNPTSTQQYFCWIYGPDGQVATRLATITVH